MLHSTDRLDLRLAALDRDQLEALVRRLLAREPDIEDLVHLPLPGEVQRVDKGPVAAQVTHILRTMGDDWQASTRAQCMLWPVVEVGEQYLERGLLVDARTVFTTIATTILRHYEQIRDEESEVAGIVGQCVEGLGRCLAVTTDPVTREGLLGDVFAVYRWDVIDHGGYGMDDAPRTVLLAGTTPAERARVATWVRSAMPQATADRYGRWRRQRAGQLVLDLLEPDLDARDRERIYAEADLDRPRLDLLLEQGRHEEAVELLRATSADELTALADRLIAAGLGDAARSAVRDHRAVLEPANHRVRDWLERQQVALPPNLEALVEAIRWFQVRTNIGSYQDLRCEAEAAGRWPAVLGMIAALDPHQKKLQPVRARVLADLGDATGALAELEGLTGSTWKSAAIDIASALEATHPPIAVDLLRRIVDVLLAHGTKAAHAQAAELRSRRIALEARIG